MPDIIELIFDDHEWFRRQFAALDELKARRRVDITAVEAVWTRWRNAWICTLQPKRKSSIPSFSASARRTPRKKPSTRSGTTTTSATVSEPRRDTPILSEEWWAEVGRTRRANDEHMAEEEREGLADFRTAPAELRESLGRRFAEYFLVHRSTKDVDTSDKDPQEYVREVEEELDEDSSAGSLRIGSLKGR